MHGYLGKAHMHAPVCIRPCCSRIASYVRIRPYDEASWHTHRLSALLKVGVSCGLIVCLGLFHIPEQCVTVLAQQGQRHDCSQAMKSVVLSLL